MTDIEKQEMSLPFVKPVKLKIYVRRPELKPIRAYPTDSGMDIKADLQLRDGSTFTNEVVLSLGNQFKFLTGIYVEIPLGFELQCRPRSGLANRQIIATFGTIDQSYRGEITVMLYNAGREDLIVTDCMRIAQIVMAPVIHPNVEYVDVLENLAPSDRGSKGFGSSGH